MKYKSLFLSIPLLCLVACSSNDDIEEVEKAPKRPIRVEVSEIPMIDSLAGNTGVKRAPITTVSSLDEFYMNYYYEGDFSTSYLWTHEIQKPGGVWVWAPQIGTAAWPQGAGNNPVTFYAYAGADWGQQGEEGPCYLDEEDGKVKLDFSMDENPEKTKDLLVSKDVKSYSQDGTIHFTFSHACAAMQFTICKTAKLENVEVKVKEIKIHHLVNNAQYIFDDENPWDLSNDYSDYTIKAYTPEQSSGSIIVGPEPAVLVGDGTNDYVFAIPQTITPWSGTGPLSNTYAEIVCSIKKGDTQYAKEDPDNDGFGSVYIPFTVPQLKQGFVHHVKIIMGTALKKNDGTSIFK